MAVQRARGRGSESPEERACEPTQAGRWYKYLTLDSRLVLDPFCVPSTDTDTNNTITIHSLTCRKRHKKCDERQPVCGPCSLSSRDCLYAPAQSPASLGARHARASARLSRESALNAEASVDQPLVSLPGVASLVSEASFRPPQAGPSPSSTTSTAPRPPTAQQPGASPGGSLSYYVYSPDTLASDLLTADLASTRWFDLLATDAAQADSGFTWAPSRPQTRPPSPSVERRTAAAYPIPPPPALSAPVPSAHPGQRPTSSVAPLAAPDYPYPSLERQEWQLEEDICLRDEEVTLFRTFTERAALWLDLFDPYKHFSTYATRLAVSNCDCPCASLMRKFEFEKPLLGYVV